MKCVIYFVLGFFLCSAEAGQRPFICIPDYGAMEEMKESSTSGKGPGDTATVTCSDGFDMMKCVCKGDCDGSRIITSNKDTTCYAYNKSGGGGVKARAFCRRLMFTCESGFDKFPKVRCPKYYRLTGCTLRYNSNIDRGNTSNVPVTMNDPSPGVCRPATECGDCQVGARCIRTWKFFDESDRLPPCKEPAPKPSTCNGEEYVYTDFQPMMRSPYSFIRTRASFEECKALCDALCGCVAINWHRRIDFAHGCDLATLEGYLYRTAEFTYSHEGTGYYIKRRKGHLDESRILSSTNSVPGADWKTCDNKEYEYQVLPRGCKTDAYSNTIWVDLDECKRRCSSDCQCKSFEFVPTTNRCCLINFNCPTSLQGPPTKYEVALYVRYEKGKKPPNLDQTCDGKEYVYYPAINRFCDTIGTITIMYYAKSISFAECKKRCSDACECKSFNYGMNERNQFAECQLLALECLPRQLHLSYTKKYYAKRERKGDCPPEFKENCHGLKYEFQRVGDKICPWKYQINKNDSFTDWTRAGCETLCAENCECEAYVYQYHDDYLMDIKDRCYLMGTGCLQNLRDDYYVDPDFVPHPYLPDYKTYGRDITKKLRF